MKKVIWFFLAICFICCLSSCTYAGMKDYSETTNNRFIEVVGQDDLYYDANTKVVYVIWNEWNIINDTGYGYMSPYYSSNGLPYSYNVETGYLEEIGG